MGDRFLSYQVVSLNKTNNINIIHKKQNHENGVLADIHDIQKGFLQYWRGRI